MSNTRKGARADKSKNDWIEFGGNLLTRISNQRKIHKKIKDLLMELNEYPCTNNDLSKKVVSKLNAEKGNLGESWIQWGAYIRGTKRDKNINAFRVSNRCYSQYKNLARTSGYIRNNGEVNLAKCVEGLPDLLAEMGITNTQDFGDLAELLKPFEDAIKHKMTRTSDDIEVPFSALAITEKIIYRLKKLHINNFSDFDKLNVKFEELTSAPCSEKASVDNEEIVNLKQKLRASNVMLNKNKITIKLLLKEISEIEK